MAFAPGKCLLPKLLKERGMTQIDLAIKLDMLPSQISEYATGNRLMTLKTAKNIAYALNCRIDDLYEWVYIGQ